MGRLAGFLCVVAALTAAFSIPATADAVETPDPTTPDAMWIEDATGVVLQELAVLEHAGAIESTPSSRFIANWTGVTVTSPSDAVELLDALAADGELLLAEADEQGWALSTAVRAALTAAPSTLVDQLSAGAVGFTQPTTYLDASSDLIIRLGAEPVGGRTTTTEPNTGEYAIVTDALRDFDTTGDLNLAAFAGATPAPPAAEFQRAPTPTPQPTVNPQNQPVGLLVALGVSGLLTITGAFALWRRRGRDDHPQDTDELTNLGNRRRFDTDLSRLITGERIGFAMVDVDHFKAFNASQGRASGDSALQRIAETIEANVREDDVVYRYGGEAFCVLFRDCDQDEALAVVERVRLAVENCSVPGADQQPTGSLTVSTGVAIGDAAEVEELAEHAGAALYSAKIAGRNTTMLHE